MLYVYMLYMLLCYICFICLYDIYIYIQYIYIYIYINVIQYIIHKYGNTENKIYSEVSITKEETVNANNTYCKKLDIHVNDNVTTLPIMHKKPLVQD